MSVTEIIRAAADRHGLDPSLVAAIVQVESSGRRYALRVESRYRWLWNVKEDRPFRELTSAESLSEDAPDDFPAPPGVTRTTEWRAQQASWGLMQVLGAVARERGFDGPDMPELTDPELNLHIGCKHLADFIARYGQPVGIGAYNAGPGGRHSGDAKRYIAKVRAAQAEYQEPADPEPDNAGAIA